MERREVLDFIVLLLLIIVLFMLIYTTVKMKSESGKCLLSPLTYGVEKWSEVNNEEMICTCSFNRINSPVFLVTKEDITIMKTNNQLVNENITIQK